MKRDSDVQSPPKGSDLRFLCAGIGKTSTLEARVSFLYWTSCSGHSRDVLLILAGLGLGKQ